MNEHRTVTRCKVHTQAGCFPYSSNKQLSVKYNRKHTLKTGAKAQYLGMSLDSINGLQLEP